MFIGSEIQKQIQMMPNQSNQISDFYQKNPSAVASLRGGIYEDKIISLIKEKAKLTKKTITVQEAEKIILNQSKKTNKDEVSLSKIKKTITKNKKRKKS